MAQFKKNHDLSGLIESAWRFTPHTFAAKASAGRWKCWPYLRYIGDAVAECIQTGGRLIINAPPRHGKSEFISFWTPLWFLSLYPDKYILLGSYGETLAADWGRKCRNEIERNPDIGIRLRSDSTSAERWHTVQGGGMACAGVGGPITGRGGNLLLADDLCKDWRDAWSPLIRSRTQEWYSSTFRTRAEPGAAIIIITTRWHADDLVGWLTEQHAEPWKIINLAALAEPGDILGRRPGEALCPQRFDEKALAATRLSIGPAAWSALYQGRPIQVGAGLAYENYSAMNVDPKLELRPDLPIQVSFDFNINPGNHVEIGQYDPKADVFTCIHEIHGPRMSIRSAMEECVGIPAGWGVQEIQIFGDASGKSQSAATAESCYDMIVARLVRANLRFRLKVPAANPPIRQRLDAFNEALRDMDGKAHFLVHPRCQKLLADFKNQKTDADGMPDESNIDLGHAAAAEGYRVHYQRPLWKVIARTMPQKAAGRIITGTG